MKERRKFVRFDTYMDTSYELLGSRPLKVKARLKDVSRNGLRLSSENALLKGSYVDMVIEVPGEDRGISAFGKVVCSKKLCNAYYDTSLRLTKIQDHSRARLLDYAYNEWIKIQRPKLATV